MSARVCLLAFAVSLVGCGAPRSKTLDAYTAAVTPNEPYRTDPEFHVDPYTFGGIADGTGGTSSKTKWGAGAPGPFEGASEIYGLLTPEELAFRRLDTHAGEFLVPDPETESYLELYYASVYLNQEGHPYPVTMGDNVIPHEPVVPPTTSEAH